VATVGERLKEERLLRGWSQRDLAREAGTTAETISSIETGQHEPRPSTLRKLAEGLDIEVRDLFMEPALPKALAREAGQPEKSLLDKALDAARQDEEKDRRAAARAFASEGLAAEVLSGYEEDKFRAELRKLGFPDEHFEDFIWPLVITSVRAERVEQENARLREENAALREQVASVE
jgi:transcriptional regulator with XRE-family HTH domain